MKSKIALFLSFFCACGQFNAHANDAIEFSGYARIIAGYFDQENVEYDGYDNSINFSPDSLIGLQLDYELNEYFALTGQVKLTDSRVSEDDSSGLEWLYLTYQPTDNIQMKLGKLRTPFFAMSDFSDVGFAYPWINLPQQVYNTYLFDTFNGIDVIYKFSGKNFDASIESYYGYKNGVTEVGNIKSGLEVDNLVGVIGKLNVSNLEFRAAKYSGDASLDFSDLKEMEFQLRELGFTQSADTLSTKGQAEAEQLSILFDNLNYFFRAEWIRITTDFEVIPSADNYYLTGGFNLGAITYHLTYGNSDVTSGSTINEIPTGVSDDLDKLNNAYQEIFRSSTPDELESWTLGVRWDVRTNIALKAEVSTLKGNDGVNSFFSSSDSQNFDKKGNLYLLGLEWVF
ncbi:hypothetical protein J8L70_12355 [Pseudoalteromonas sp. MMG010]|uniref:hypothetical protein n=1 Tax=Pseudoalteromonas sp. MMG010 TaxID=2822685 RepID=UPI001B39DE1F|nr:hypothetical protein [Pseudoalteromonas sp. MMG010]MBQ4834036.1 hypothetical protein [Pseudoalteromonas sp. MMG010]